MHASKWGRLVRGFIGRPRSASSWTPVCLQRPQHTVTCHTSAGSVDPDELRRFQSLAGKWWDDHGEFAALHALNDLRVPFIRDNLMNVHRTRVPGKPLGGIRILDVGCGGGLLTEPLGRLGANVLGIDPVADSIGTAKLHSSIDPDLRNRVRYRACTLEDLSAEREGGGQEEQGLAQFDAVVASEVVEHLADLETFGLCCNHVLKPGGSLFITTINKTKLSYALGIVAAEQLLRIVPSGTHDWEKFISPVELERLLESNGFSVGSVRGMLYNPVSGVWCWTDSTAINYALHAVKVRDDPEAHQAEDRGPRHPLPEGHVEAAHS
ncbi:ubiquinone biosynthesis O-methyltransferase, mitochondrial [Pungitius pungitius]|uniref:ubiquinone biosynthesis O-methyltransferase, mitochondrial n=1 Tax=Pungitius pungitius TaxID=134920 RepID=UPI002E11E60E